MPRGLISRGFGSWRCNLFLYHCVALSKLEDTLDRGYHTPLICWRESRSVAFSMISENFNDVNSSSEQDMKKTKQKKRKMLAPASDAMCIVLLLLLSQKHMICRNWLPCLHIFLLWLCVSFPSSQFISHGIISLPGTYISPLQG